MKALSFAFGGLAAAYVCACGNGQMPNAVLGDKGASPRVRNADCAHFCNQLPPGPERGECTSNAAHGTGLCVECQANLGLLCPTLPSLDAGLTFSGNLDAEPPFFEGHFCCSAGQTCCGVTNLDGGPRVACTDLQNDPLNCGTCGNVCPSGFCAQGACCAPGTTAVCQNTNLDGGPAFKACVDTTNDVNNCGACGHSCGPGGTCRAGLCCTPQGCLAGQCGVQSDGCGAPIFCGVCGFPDAGVFPDGGFPDAGFLDAGFPDAGFPDAGFPDAGPAPSACSNTATSVEVFSPTMSGCRGSVSFSSRATLCATACHACSAQEWVTNRGGRTPSTTYWTGDTLGDNGGTTNNCAVGPAVLPGFSNHCGMDSSMLVCPSGSPNCVLTGCGSGSNSPNELFGGCSQPVSSIASGTLCCCP